MEELKIVEQVITEQKEQGVDEAKIYKEAYEFTKTLLEGNLTDKICKLNEQISDGIKELAYLQNWPNLDSVALHAMDCCLDCIKKDKLLKKFNIEETITFKLFVLNKSRKEILPYLNEKAKKEFFKGE